MLDEVPEGAPPPAAPEPETQLSADGSWWWNGAAWVPAISGDGLWRWNGTGWQPAVELDPSDPAALAGALDRLADERFAEGGYLLALRAHEWRPRTPELAELVAEAAPLATRLSTIDAQFAGLDEGRRPLRGLLGGGDRDQLEADARDLEQRLRPLTALIGRTAPQPSLKDADEVLVPARRLHERVLELQGALAELDRIRTEHAERVAAAQAELDQARSGRDRRMGEIEERVRAREAEHERAVSELTAALRTLRIPVAGAPRARFLSMTLFDNRLDTPDGRGPVEGSRALLGTAAELGEREPARVGELWLLEVVHAAHLHDALVAGSDERFLLVETPRVASVVPVPEGGEAEAEAFKAALEEAAVASRRWRKEWREQVSAAEAALEAALADTTAVDEARAELERERDNPELAAPVLAAQRRLDDAERPTPVLEAAEQRVSTLVDRLLARPEPLPVAAAG